MIFQRKTAPDINAGIRECKENNGVLLDVRSAEEYEEIHVPGSVNISVSEIEKVKDSIPTDAKVYVYCRSGARAESAVRWMKENGYTDVKNIGGILQWKE